MSEFLVLRMMPDYGGAIWRIAGPMSGRHDLSPELSRQLRDWAEEWEEWHCDLRDDLRVDWVERGRELHAIAAAEFDEYGILLLADFEGSKEEKVARRRRWREEFGD